MIDLDLKIYRDGKLQFNYHTKFEDVTYVEEYIALKKSIMEKENYKIIDTSSGFYFFNAKNEKIEYKFTF